MIDWKMYLWHRNAQVEHMKPHYLLLFSLTLLLTGAYVPPASSSKAVTSEMMADVWINPTIACSLNNGERPIKRYPVDKGKKSDKPDDPEGFANFCTRMQTHFTSSGVTLPEADTVYTAIPNGNYNKTE